MRPEHSQAHYNCSGPIKKTNEACAYHVTQVAERGGTETGRLLPYCQATSEQLSDRKPVEISNSTDPFLAETTFWQKASTVSMQVPIKVTTFAAAEEASG